MARVKAGQGVNLGDHADIIFERKDLPDTYPVDRLRIGKNNPNRSVVCALIGLKCAVGRTGIGKFRLGRYHRFRDQNSFSD